MTKIKWNKVADIQFKQMPIDFQDDWADLRKLTK